MNNEQFAEVLTKIAKEYLSDDSKIAAKPLYDNRAYHRNRLEKMGAEVIKPEGIDLEIFTWEEERKGKEVLLGMAFAGKSTKHLWYYRFRNEREREQRIEETIDSRKKKMEEKAQRRKERSDFAHGYEKGDILYSSWGYDQTNIDFYQVTDVKGKMIVVREVEKEMVKDHGSQYMVMPIKNDFKGSPMRKKVQKGYDNGSKGTIKIASYAYAYEWDGTPKSETAPGWGH